LLDEIEEEQKKDAMTRDFDKVLELNVKIAEKSSRFYELIPDSRYRQSAVPSIDTEHLLK